MYGNSLMGIQDPRMQIPSQVSRETTGPSSNTLRGTADGAQQPGIGYQSPSQGLFAAYMQNLFQQKYRPQQNLGGYQNFGAYGGFMPPNLPKVAQPQTQPMPGPGTALMPGQTWGQYYGGGS